MVITNTFKTLLFVSSFSPLYIILIVKFYNFNKSFLFNLSNYSFAYFILLFLLLISILTFIYFYKCDMNSETKFNGIVNKNSDILTYFITYVVPLTTLDIYDINSIIINILLFIVIGVFYVK